MASRPIVIVCGGRDWRDYGAVLRVLTQMKVCLVVAGDATGADALALRAGVALGVNTCKHNADWDKYGRAAGPIRNQEMLDLYPSAIVVAFPGGRGTADMTRRARKAGRRLIEPMRQPDTTPSPATTESAPESSPRN